MAIKINNNPMPKELDGKIIATARQRDSEPATGGKSPTGQGFFDRDQAITALVPKELSAKGCDSSHPLMSTLQARLR